VRLKACQYFGYQLLVRVVGKGKERPKSWLAHPVKDVHNSFPDYEGVFSGELDELWHGWGSSGPDVCKNRLSLICGCRPVGGASLKGLCDSFEVDQPRRQIAAVREDSIALGVVSDSLNEEREIVRPQNGQRLVLVFIVVLLEPFMHRATLVGRFTKGISHSDRQTDNDHWQGNERCPFDRTSHPDSILTRNWREGKTI
jgi:hypothetical protein